MEYYIVKLCDKREVLIHCNEISEFIELPDCLVIDDPYLGSDGIKTLSQKENLQDAINYLEDTNINFR